jgi:hypothetical protein
MEKAMAYQYRDPESQMWKKIKGEMELGVRAIQPQIKRAL